MDELLLSRMPTTDVDVILKLTDIDENIMMMEKKQRKGGNVSKSKPIFVTIFMYCA